ncbi:hypothetical protein LCGC14_2568300, partial [marine sediment metagenome]
MTKESQQLITSILAGDNDACERVVKLYSDYVRRILCSITQLAPVDIDDLQQEVFLRVFTKLSGFHRKSELSTWVYSIARNVGFDYLRRLQQKRNLKLEFRNHLKGLDDDGYSFVFPDEISVLDRAVMQEKIEYVFSILTEDQKRLVILRAQGYTYKELGECFGVSHNT